MGGVSKKKALNGADFKTFKKADMKFFSPVSIRLRTVMKGISWFACRATNLNPSVTASFSNVNWPLPLHSSILDFDLKVDLI